jgi:DNA-binding XRE family transcriptional regulator
MKKKSSQEEKLPVRVYREELGLSRSELSRLIGISERSLADIELGKSIPKLETLIAMARVCKKSLKIMIKGIGLDVSDIPDDVPLVKNQNRALK